MAFIKKRKSQTEASEDLGELNTPSDVLNFAESKGIEVDPLDVSKLTRALDITMHFEPMPGDESGSLVKVKKSGKWIMKINSLHHPHRQRFTIAHEIGHHIKHGALSDEFIDTTFFRNNESNQMEAEANRFAAELLMPKEKYDNFVNSKSQKIEDIAEYFQVSSMAVRIRAKQLGYEGHNV